MNVWVYSCTALAALGLPVLHLTLFDNVKKLPKTAHWFKLMHNNVQVNGGALNEYVASSDAVKHIHQKFDEVVGDIPRARHVHVGQRDLWKPMPAAAPRELVQLPLDVALTVPTLMEELEELRASGDAWVRETRIDPSIKLVLDSDGDRVLTGLSVAELMAALDGSMFRSTPPDYRFHYFGVTRAQVGVCMLLEATLATAIEDGWNTALVDDSRGATTVLFRSSPGLSQMQATLVKMQEMIVRTAGMRTA